MMPVSEDHELHDLRALVTGGTRGIGHAVAARLREAGARVLVTARTALSGVPDTDFVAGMSPHRARRIAAPHAAASQRPGGRARSPRVSSSLDRLSKIVLY